MLKEVPSSEVGKVFDDLGWFNYVGSYILLDGQFGSTGKGLLAAYLAHHGADKINVVTSNAGPNSGHTAYSPIDDTKWVSTQIPIASALLNQMGKHVVTYMNGGAILDLPKLRQETKEFNLDPARIVLNPAAAVIEDQDRGFTASLTKIASTGKGVGQAMARKLLREGNVVKSHADELNEYTMIEFPYSWDNDVVFVETSQGFSLSLNSQFYPHCTSRECTIQQALADARIHPRYYNKSILSLRTYPIRVGNIDGGYSGDFYEDQQELTWEEIGQEPEVTTVTKRIRRVFSWSWLQFEHAVIVNEPDALFINFTNYLLESRRLTFIQQVTEHYRRIRGRYPDFVLAGEGPRCSDVKLYRWSKVA